MQYRKLTTFLCPDKICRRLRRVNAARTINSFCDSDCWYRFRTRKQDLYRLLRAFKLSDDEDEYIVADNGCKYLKEEILLIGLHRYCVPGPLLQTMGNIFSIDYTIFTSHLIDNFTYLLTYKQTIWHIGNSTYTHLQKLFVTNRLRLGTYIIQRESLEFWVS